VPSPGRRFAARSRLTSYTTSRDTRRDGAIQQTKTAEQNNLLKSVVVRVVWADVQPLIAVPSYAGVRVVSGIVVGISRRETQTCACYERDKAPTSKASHTKPPPDGGGANPWSYRGRAEPGTNSTCAEPRTNRGRAEPWANRGRADPNTPKATTDGSASEAMADGSAPEATADGSAPEATADGSTPEATAAKSTPAEATTLSKSPIREHRCQYQGRSSSKPRSFHGRLLYTTVTSLKNISG
jgi:hypothetical protein